MTAPTARPRIDLYVRSLSPTGADRSLKDTIKRLQSMDEANRIAGFSVEVWGERIPCDPQTRVGRSMLERIETFKTWSDRAGTSLSPFFETRESKSLLTGESRDTIVPPVVCLVESNNDSLQHVAPCVDDGTVRTVLDRLDTLEEEVHDIERKRTVSD